MKITVSFPRHKGNIKGTGFDVIYVVLQRYEGRSRQWGIANSWDLPFTSCKYTEAVIFKRAIAKRHKAYYWPKDALTIIKMVI